MVLCGNRNGGPMNTEHFTYERSWAEIETMLDKAERKQNWHYMNVQSDKAGRIEHMRNYKALEGVVKSHPLE